MNDEQYRRAYGLKQRRAKIQRELDILGKELTRKEKLGYLQSWNSNHATKLETNISDAIFEGFRNSAMDNLKLELVQIDAEFTEI